MQVTNKLEQDKNMEQRESHEQIEQDNWEQVYVDADRAVIDLKKAREELANREQGLIAAEVDLESEGEYSPETLEHARNALEESKIRMEHEKSQIEQEVNNMDTLRSYRNKFIMGVGMLSGMDQPMMWMDSAMKKSGQKGLFTTEERVKMCTNKAMVVKYGAKIMKPFLPIWAKALLVPGAKVAEYQFNLMGEKERISGEENRKMGLRDMGKFTMKELFGKVKKEDLQDPEKVKEAGEAISEFGGEIEGELGEKIKALGKKFEDKPEEAGEMLADMKNDIENDVMDFGEDTDEVLDQVADKEDQSLTERLIEGTKEKAKDATIWAGKGLLELSFYIPGQHDLIRVVDRYAGGALNKEKGGVIFSKADHARIARNQAKLGKYGVKAIGLFVPEVKLAMPLVKGREKLENMKYKLAKEGKELSTSEYMSEIARIIPEKKLNDEKTIIALGDLIVKAGKEVGDTTGEVISGVGEFIKDNPKAGSAMLVHLRKLIIDREFKADEHIDKFTDNMARNWKNKEVVKEMGEFDVNDKGHVVEAETVSGEEKLAA